MTTIFAMGDSHGEKALLDDSIVRSPRAPQLVSATYMQPIWAITSSADLIVAARLLPLMEGALRFPGVYFVANTMRFASILTRVR